MNNHYPYPTPADLYRWCGWYNLGNGNRWARPVRLDW